MFEIMNKTMWEDTVNILKQKLYQRLRITRKNGKTEHRGRTYVKNEVVLEPGWISDAFDFRYH